MGLIQLNGSFVKNMEVFPALLSYCCDIPEAIGATTVLDGSVVFRLCVH